MRRSVVTNRWAFIAVTAPIRSAGSVLRSAQGVGSGADADLAVDGDLDEAMSTLLLRLQIDQLARPNSSWLRDWKTSMT